MKINCSHTLAAVALAFGLGASSVLAAAPATAQGIITGKEFSNINGTAIATLTGDSRFPDNPDAIFFFPYFEWAATGDIFTPPGDYSNNYGGQIVGYFYPPTTGDYVFFLSADDNAVLYLSPDDNPENKKLIAQETEWSNAREYEASGGGSDIASKDSSQFVATEWETIDPFWGGALISLRAGQPVYMEALFKEGGGGDNLSVAVIDPNFAIDLTLPIPGEFLSSDRTAGPVSIVEQPQSQAADERGAVRFSVLADGTPPYTYQWRKNGTDIAGATELAYTIDSAAVADNTAVYSVVVSGAQGNATSQDAVLTVIPDTTPPAVLSTKASPNRTEVVLSFTEGLDEASATVTGNYQISSASGSLNVTGADLSPGGTSLTLTTAQQTLGTKYTILISNVQDAAATPNTIGADTKAVYFPTGKLVERDGFIVFEAENYDRNLDDLWVRDTERGNPSGGVSMVVPNGTGGGENNSKLEYDVEFNQAATYIIWYRASGDDGTDDSAWFHLDGARPFERENANDAAMTGFSGALDFVWRADSFGGADPMSVDILFPGPAVVGLAQRENGSFFDKFILTTDTSFSPSGLGLPETREGAPGLPSVTLTAPTSGEVFSAGGNITLSADAAGESDLDISRIEYSANGNVIGESTDSPFSYTWSNVENGIFAIRAKAFDEIGQSVTSDGETITVGNPPPQALFVVGTDSDPTLNDSDAGILARLESQGWQVTVVQAPPSTTSDGDGKQLIVISSTVNSGDVGDKFRNSPVPVVNWEQAVQDNFLMTLDVGSDRGTLDGQTEVDIIDAGHPLAGGLSTGLKTVTTEAQSYSWGVPNQNATIIATVADNPDQALIYGYEEGAILADDSTPSPARRVMFFPGNDGFAAFTEDALRLLDAAVEWASGIAPQTSKPTSANIAWVSFHSGDDTPTDAAAAVGMNQAADIAYTDLLGANGHAVTRIVTTGNPDTAFLNLFDLVVISRSVNSGDYQDPAEAAAWNGITTPTLILTGYVLRTSRLGLTTGTSMIDTVGPVSLNVNDPSHPIFEGIDLNGANTMVNPYADVVNFAGAVQRGISVNADLPAGNGTVLATIATADDPAVDGMVIGEWQAGAFLENGGQDTLAGNRLVFLTGSREVGGVTGNTAGIFDLSADGTQMFMNAVNYMAGTEPGPVVVGGGDGATLSLTRTVTGISLEFSGTLQSADSVTGPWSDETAATSPFAVTPTGGMKFYRAKE